MAVLLIICFSNHTADLCYFSFFLFFFLLLDGATPTPVAGVVIPNFDKPGTDILAFFVGAVGGTIVEHFTGLFSGCNALEWIYS